MPQTSDTQWPPRSPHEALLSTPGGRDRLRRLAERASPSPSPIKRSKSAASLRKRTTNVDKGSFEDEDEEDEEDEETLQLRLQEIQARLRLKKLQRKAKQGPDSENDTCQAPSAAYSRASSVATNRTQSRASVLREEQLHRPKSQASVHVPVSPVRRARPEENPRSPGRVLLGIDKGLKGSDISLKRAPSLRNPQETNLHEARRGGGFLQRANSQAENRSSTDTTSSQSFPSATGPRTFNERLAAMRGQETDRQERDVRRRKARSMAFDIDRQEMEGYKKNAVELPDVPLPAPQFSRDDILNSYNRPASGMTRSKTTPSLLSSARTASDSTNSTSTLTSTARPQSQASVEEAGHTAARKWSSAKSKSQPDEVSESEVSEFEPYSSTHLSKRIIPHKVLTRTFTGKKTFLIPDLLGTVKAPTFSAPDIEEDMVVLAVIAEKSEPKSHQSTGKNEQRGKFMIMKLTDLKWELDLFLFDSAFDRFWKLAPGTIIAILNPAIMPPPRGKADTGKFSLTLNSSEDTVLEIGSARDLGFCKSVKKDGKTCDNWVDKRHTEFCDFHVNQQLRKTKASRMEVNSMSFGKGGGFSSRNFGSKDTMGYSDRRKQSEAEKSTRYDRESHSQIYISGNGRSSAKLLDDVDFDPDAFHRGTTREERLKRHLVAKEKERDLAEKLGKIGGGIGADYLRMKASSHTHQGPSEETPAEPPPPDAASLGLLGGKARDLHLSPIKRKRANTSSSAAAIGWGGNLTKELGRMKNGENLNPPVKKKTRFVTEKGIREAGRESFGGEMAIVDGNDLDDDDDDDLDIVK